MSLHETVPDARFIARVRMTLFPTATPAAGTVIVVLVPLLLGAMVPIVLTHVICAATSELNSAADKKQRSMPKND